jgi:hypothetical protein
MTLQLRTLLWLDCTAAGIVGVSMLALSSWLAPLFGVARGVLVTTALFNLAYGVCSCALARRPEAPPGWVRALVVANAVWVLVCLGLTAYHARPGSWLGAGYLFAEALFVGALAAAEARASRPLGVDAHEGAL